MKQRKGKSFDTIKFEFKIGEIEIEVPFQKVLCPIGKEPFKGTAIISLDYENRNFPVVPEYISLTKWVQSFEEETIESLAHRIFAEIKKRLNPKHLRITIRAKSPVHAPLSITIEDQE